MTYKLNRDKTVAVDLKNEWQPMSTCPLAARVQLLGAGGVAVYGSWDGKSTFWRGWHPLPRRSRTSNVDLDQGEAGGGTFDGSASEEHPVTDAG